jgi:hypothetical protein
MRFRHVGGTGAALELLGLIVRHSLCADRPAENRGAQEQACHGEHRCSQASCVLHIQLMILREVCSGG